MGNFSYICDMRPLQYTFLRDNYSYNSLLDYMEENIPYVKKSYKIFEVLKPYINEEMKYRLDYPETESLSVEQCIVELREHFMFYGSDPSLRHHLLKSCRELWDEQRTSGYIGRVMLRLSKLIY